MEGRNKLRRERNKDRMAKIHQTNSKKQITEVVQKETERSQYTKIERAKGKRDRDKDKKKHRKKGRRTAETKARRKKNTREKRR